jgi:hypothetical protein
MMTQLRIVIFPLAQWQAEMPEVLFKEMSHQPNGFETSHPCQIDESSGDHCLLESNDEILACGLHHFFGHHGLLIGD